VIGLALWQARSNRLSGRRNSIMFLTSALLLMQPLRRLPLIWSIARMSAPPTACLR